ncbi:MAG: aminotransferase class I/II-fold pyridoxal phosphate-dependent enzyme [Lachnospiraceae bacterium]|nr:aminotransferase class I/II-fold pyridoxal phosphate-dependent enzyme [Lachnospiraceae bacterium]
MARHTHGGNIYQYGNVLDFSANLNPLGMPELVRRAAVSGAMRAEHYPEPDCAELRERIGRRLGVGTGQVICGNGATELIFLAAAAIRPRRALLLAPTYAEYEEAFSAYGCECRYHFLREKDGFLPGEDFLEAVTGDYDLVAVCNPNNPTGLLLERDFVGRLLERCREAGSILFLDESFMELTGKKEAASAEPFLRSEQLFLLRSMTKTYAMAGLRLGYAVSGNRGLVDDMYRYKPSWNVSIPAQAAGEAASSEAEYLARSVLYIGKERQFLLDGLAAFPVRVYPGAANYLFFSCGREDLREAFLEQGILIRDCGNYRGLKAGYYRVAVRTHAENQQLLHVFGQVFGKDDTFRRLRNSKTCRIF